MAAALVGQCARVFLDSSKTSACRAQSTLRIWEADQASSASAIWTNLAATNERRKNAEGASKIGPKHTHNATLLFLCSRTFDAVAVLIARSRLNQNMKGEYLLVRHDVAIAAPGPTDCHLI
jgi:hypothetical protein